MLKNKTNPNYEVSRYSNIIFIKFTRIQNIAVIHGTKITKATRFNEWLLWELLDSNQ
jgi:hypothetical protein